MTDKKSDDSLIASIVSSFATRPEVGPDEIVELVRKLRNEVGASAPVEQAPTSGVATPARPISEAVERDKVYCLCCGKGFKMLKRHIASEHGLTEERYRHMFGLSDDFPLVAPSYSEKKANYAKSKGLGKYSRQKNSGSSKATHEKIS
ncbi:MucR family transcriptional regulator [Roseivivax sp. THAF40]|uniref:MucR family transcriptional regulator n=1 Tax=Roseivivax sp. THAF40 TaxID=2587858 RepID=UPI0012694BFD|nr:MucR family transcriptional regulator [Roseivivax sp. THAF40]